MAAHSFVPLNKLPSCEACHNRPAAGGYLCTFSTGQAVLALCAACGLTASKRWPGGYMRRKLERIELVVVIIPVPPIYLKGELAEELALQSHVATAEAQCGGGRRPGLGVVAR